MKVFWIKNPFDDQRYRLTPVYCVRTEIILILVLTQALSSQLRVRRYGEVLMDK